MSRRTTHRTGDYAADLNYFATSGVSNGPVNLLSNGAAGGNSVYRYSSTTTFPSLTYNATNYWVDIVFSDTGTPACRLRLRRRRLRPPARQP